MKRFLKILIVDDNRDLASNIQDILQDGGYDVTLAFDGAGAIDCCQDQQFDIALLDFKLPDMDGLELQKKLSKMIDADYIVITAHASIESASLAVQRKQVVGYETKPLDFNRLLSFIQQVVERRTAQAELKKSEATARAFMNMPNAAAFLIDTDGVCLSANQTMAERFGKTVDDLIGNPIWDLFPPEISRRRKIVIEKVIREKIQITCEDERDGMWNESHITPVLDDRGNVSKITVVGFDITERKQAEKKRIEMERRILEMQRLESLYVMAGGIAHDFNNILMVVLGNIELAMEDAGGSSKLIPYLEESESATHRALNLVRQMMAYSGRGHFITSPIHINTVIEDISELLRAPLSPKAFLNIVTGTDIPAINGDESQVRQVIMNLVTNAYESTDEEKGGIITLLTGIERYSINRLKKTVSEVWMEYDMPLKEGWYVFLEVKDRGAGMEEMIRRRIFEPFFTTKFQGRGLGLSAVIGIVRGHKGFIHVDSKPGGGTCVRVLFPAIDQPRIAQIASHASESQPQQQHNRRVLFVDDEKQIRQLVRQMIERMGYATLIASDGAHAIEMYRRYKHRIDAIIMDLKMPRMDGIEAFEELKRLDCNIPVILSSGYTEEEIKQYSSEGFAAFIQKPYKKHTLKNVLMKVMKNKHNENQ